MSENIKVRWLTDHEQTKVAPKTLSSQVYNEDGTLLKDSIENSLQTLNENIAASLADVNAAIAEKLDKTDITQADWNQNDETASDYIKNRTHWIEQGSRITLFENTVECEPSSSALVMYYASLSLSEPMVIGNEYLITYDNIEYSLIAEDDNDGGVYVGNYEWETEEIPFCIYTAEDGEYMLETMVEGTHTLKIQHVEADTYYHPLDEKFIPDTIATREYVENLYKKLNSNTVLGFYCIEDVAIVTNGISKTYPANSNVEITFIEDDTFEIIPTSDNSILSLTAFPGVLGTFYPWLEGVAQFSNILFNMNDEAMYSKWSQGNQGAYHVQKAQYINCIFWSDNPYISDVAKRTNYTLTHTSQLPLCYSSIPDNTFKSFYLAFGVNSDPNWGNQAYRDSFAKATWATQVFSYYGARTIGIVGHDDPDFNIVLPKDCRGLMFDARHIENAGTFDAVNVTNFGAKSGSWREAFGFCTSLKRLFIKNLKVSLNTSWSPIDYESINYIISAATNTSAITISVSPYTYNLLNQSDFDLAASKNITIALLTSNYVEDKRLSAIADKADKSYVDEQIADLVNSAPETLDTLGELATAMQDNDEVIEALNQAITNKADKTDVLLKAEQTLTDEELTQVRKNLKFIGRDVEGQSFTIDGVEVVASPNAEIFGDYVNNKCTGQWSIVEGSTNVATGRVCHVEGANNQALNDGCHVEGVQCIASGYWSHAEGEMTRVTSYASHAEGSYTKMPDGTTRYGTASGYASHIEGGGSHASGSCSHAEGLATTAKGNYSHTEGRYTTAGSNNQHVEGCANIEDTESKYIHIAGNGDFGAPSNAHTLDWDGNAWFSGDVYIGSTSGTNKDEGSKKLATEDAIPTKVSQLDNDNEYITETELAAKNYLTSFTETDPTVPAWAKAASKPSYTAAEVGALPLSGGTMTGELRLNGGDVAGGSKIVLLNGKGQITASGTQTLFGFTAESTIAVGHSSFILAMRGSGTRPKYNSKDVALMSDIPTVPALSTETWTFTLEDGSTVTKAVYVG